MFVCLYIARQTRETSNKQDAGEEEINSILTNWNSIASAS
jgi:hypothetical protein